MLRPLAGTLALAVLPSLEMERTETEVEETLTSFDSHGLAVNLSLPAKYRPAFHNHYKHHKMKLRAALVCAGSLVAIAVASRALITDPPSLSNSGGDVFPPVVFTTQFFDSGGAPWTTPLLGIVTYDGDSGLKQTESKVFEPDATGAAEETLYLSQAPGGIPLNIRFLSEVDTIDTRVDRTYTVASEGLAGFQRGTPVPRQSGLAFDVTLGSTTLTPPPKVGEILLSPGLARSAQLFTEGAFTASREASFPDGVSTNIQAGTTLIELFSWGRDGAWWFSLQDDVLGASSSIESNVRRGGQVFLSGTFSAQVNGTVNLTNYPGASLAILTKPGDYIPNLSADTFSAFSYQLRFLGEGNFSKINPSGGGFGPINTTYGPYTLEVWGEDSAGDPLRLYEQNISVSALTNTFSVN